MAVSYSLVSFVTPAATGFDSVLKGNGRVSFSRRTNCSIVSFRDGPVPQAFSAKEMSTISISRMASDMKDVARIKCCRFVETKRCGSLAAVPSDISTVEENVGTEKPSEEGLVSTILSLVKDSDRGAGLAEEERDNIATLVNKLEEFGIAEPLDSPFLFGDWDVAYCSNPVAIGQYRTFPGRLIFKTKEMFQKISAPDDVMNSVRFAFLGFIDGEAMLQGKLKVVGQKLFQIDFQPPKIRIGPFKFSNDKLSSVQVSVLYLNDKLRVIRGNRLGRGSTDIYFIFQRRPTE